MTRKGKIARLPKHIREELNCKLDDGELGVKLVEWLNALPEVNAVLKADFEGQPISESNLTQWKKGGFLDWLARREAREVIQDWPVECGVRNAECGMSDKVVASGEMVESLTNALVAHYAAALRESNGDSNEEPGKRVERLGKSLREMSRLRRYELARERFHEHVRIGEEWVALERERLELERERLNRQAPGASDEERERLSHEEKAEMVKRMLEEA
jgi:hypothetical protein